MKKFIYISLFAVIIPSFTFGQYIDDIYYSPKREKDQKKDVIKKEEVKEQPNYKNGAKEIVFIESNTGKQIHLDSDTVYLLAEAIDSNGIYYDEDDNYSSNVAQDNSADYEYTERIRRFHSDDITIQIIEPSYNAGLYADADWTIYVDGGYGWATPSYSYWWHRPYLTHRTYMGFAYTYDSWYWNSYWGYDPYFWNSYWSWGYYPTYNYWNHWGYYPHHHWGHHGHHGYYDNRYNANYRPRQTDRYDRPTYTTSAGRNTDRSAISSSRGTGSSRDRYTVVRSSSDRNSTNSTRSGVRSSTSGTRNTPALGTRPTSSSKGTQVSSSRPSASNTRANSGTVNAQSRSPRTNTGVSSGSGSVSSRSQGGTYSSGSRANRSSSSYTPSSGSGTRSSSTYNSSGRSSSSSSSRSSYSSGSSSSGRSSSYSSGSSSRSSGSYGGSSTRSSSGGGRR